jgi:uncharacterized protein (DUF4213/DUF364 family)
VTIIDDLIASLDRAAVPREVRVGPYWTAVVVERGGELQGGLSTTLRNDSHPHRRSPVENAGSLLDITAAELAELARSNSLIEASIGMATINALLDVDEADCTEVNASDIIIREGTGKRVAVVGHFPFIPQVREAAEELWVLELRPQPGDLPADRSPEIIPRADVVAITGTSLINRTFEHLMAMCRPDAYTIVLGGSAPLSRVLFGYGVDAVAGTKVVDVPAVLRAVSQAAIFRAIPGKRLLTMEAGASAR